MPEISEDQFQANIIDLCDYLGLRVYHIHRTDLGRTNKSGKGYPDLTIVGPSGVIFAELKRDNGKVTPEQVQWLNALGKHAEAYVWRPKNWVAVSRRLQDLAKEKK